MKRQSLERYKNKRVVIGVPHTFKDNALFFYHGVLSDFGEDALTLSTDDGDMLIDYNRILQLKDISSSGGKYVREK